MVVVGSGAIGVEFAYFYNSIGTEVTIVEYMDRIVPVEDVEVSKALEKNLQESWDENHDFLRGNWRGYEGCRMQGESKKLPKARKR